MKKIILCACMAVALMFGFESEGMIINSLLEKCNWLDLMRQTRTVELDGELTIDYDVHDTTEGPMIYRDPLKVERRFGEKAFEEIKK